MKNDESRLNEELKMNKEELAPSDSSFFIPHSSFDPFNYSRRKTSAVQIGDTPLGGIRKRQ